MMNKFNFFEFCQQSKLHKVERRDETRKRYPIVLDIADTIYITNYLLGYYAI